MKKRLLFAISLLLCFSCNNEPTKIKIVLNLKAGLNEHVYIDRIAFNDEKQTVVDSAIVTDNHHPIIFYLPAIEERLYQIRITNSNMRIMFITDSKEIKVNANWFNNKYEVLESAGTAKLKSFQADQLKIADQLKEIQNKMNKQGIVYHLADTNSLVKAFNTKLAEVNKRLLNYADTVSDPVIFMIIYNSIEFGNDRLRLKKFTANAAHRFAGYKPIQVLNNNLKRYLDIFENKFKIGDKLPAIVLPDTLGQNFSTVTLKGKYYLLSFWSTYCLECELYNKEEKKLSQSIPANQFTVVNVAIDDETDVWKKIIKNGKYNWTQLIDEKMWNGNTVSILKVDSIPSNFFVSPAGRILAINIPLKKIYPTVYDTIKLARYNINRMHQHGASK